VANEGRREWNIRLVNTRTKQFVNDDAGVFQVFTAGAANHVTIFDSAGASATQEVSRVSYLSQTMTDGALRFWTARTVSNVDVSVLTAGGRAYFLDNLVQSRHRVDVDPEATEFVLTALWSEGGSVTTVKPNGFQLKPGMVIKDLIFNVTIAPTGSLAAARTFDFGRSGDPNGFANAQPLSAVAYFRPIVRSSTGLLAAANQPIGADLARFLAVPTATAETFASRHVYLPAGTITGLASNNLTYNRAGAHTGSITNTDANVGEGYVYYLYTLVPAVQAANVS